MGVYIKGMKMPTDNTVLLRIYPKGNDGVFYVEQLDIDGDILDKYWAVPVPPHGRLIDADALSEEHRKRAYETNGGSYQFHITAKAWVDEATTIIEADEGET